MKLELLSEVPGRVEPVAENAGRRGLHGQVVDRRVLDDEERRDEHPAQDQNRHDRQSHVQRVTPDVLPCPRHVAQIRHPDHLLSPGILPDSPSRTSCQVQRRCVDRGTEPCSGTRRCLGCHTRRVTPCILPSTPRWADPTCAPISPRKAAGSSGRWNGHTRSAATQRRTSSSGG